jgi:hypothetical protein
MPQTDDRPSIDEAFVSLAGIDLSRQAPSICLETHMVDTWVGATSLCLSDGGIWCLLLSGNCLRGEAPCSLCWC